MDEKQKPPVKVTEGRKSCTYCRHPLFTIEEKKQEYHTECHTLMELYEPIEFKPPKIVLDFLDDFHRLNFEEFKWHLRPKIELYYRSKESKDDIINQVDPAIYNICYNVDDFTFNENQEVVAIDFGNVEYAPEGHIRRGPKIKIRNALVSRSVFVLPDSIGRFKKLKRLNLGGHHLSELPKSIMECRSLQHLYLSGSMFDYIGKSRRFNCDAFAEANKLDQLEYLTLKYLGIEELPEGFSKLEKLKYLNMSQNRLKELPKSFGILGELNWLDLSNNEIDILPESFEILSSLNYLNLQSNKLKKLSTPLYNLDKLEKLHLRYNKINQLNESKSITVLENLELLDLAHNSLHIMPYLPIMPKLQELDMTGNKMDKLPKNIGRLLTLEKLKLDDNRLLRLPESIGELIHLQTLSLQSNNISKLPDGMGNLQSLVKLDLDKNFLAELPFTLMKLKHLERLYLRKNLLEQLPDNLGDLLSLKSLNIESNPILHLPASITKLVNLEYLEVRDTSPEVIESVHSLFQHDLHIIDSHEAYHALLG